MAFEAKIIEDSIYEGSRLTTLQLKYPRFIHCFDDRTEVLTQLKDEAPVFRTFKEAKRLNTKVAQVHKDTLAIEFVTPKAWIESVFKGELLNFSNQRLSFSVTDEHRLLVGSRKSNGYKDEIILAKDLLGEHTAKRFYKSGGLSREVRKDHSDEFMKLLAYFISDGCCHKVGNQASFNLRKQRKIKEVERLLNVCDVTYSKKEYKTSTKFVFTKEDVWMSCYNQKGEKTLPDWAWNMSYSNFEAFKQGLLESDGNEKNREFNTFSEDLIEKLQALFHINFSSFNIKKYGDCYKVKFLTEDMPILRRDKHKVQKIPYSGFVYCCTVPTGLILVRRNGIVHISGNCEFMTHRVFSRNASSSRAIPVAKMIEQVRTEPAMPIHWGKNQPGMQANEELNSREKELVKHHWLQAAEEAAWLAEQMNDLGAHKQVVNRILEPFQWISVVCTATDYDNFFHLRCHEDAQPEIKLLADMMKKVMDENKPKELRFNEYHLPYVSSVERSEYSTSDCVKFSVARCARVSYLTHDGKNPSPDKDIELFTRLVGSKPLHASPAEHQARPTRCDCWTENEMSGNFYGAWDQFRKYLEGEKPDAF